MRSGSGRGRRSEAAAARRAWGAGVAGLAAAALLISCGREDRGYRVDPPSAETVHTLTLSDLRPGPAASQPSTQPATQASTEPSTQASTQAATQSTTMPSGWPEA